MEAITARRPTRFCGIGGERMIKAGLSPIFHARDLSVMGLVEVAGKLATVRRAFKAATSRFAEGDIKLAVLIDAPDFNLRLAARAKKAGVPVIYFISPKVWAWRKSRLKTIARLVDHMMLVLPFETPIYEQAGIPATYVGNPLVDEAADVSARAPEGGRWRPSDFGLDNDRPLVGLLPGSRAGEVRRIVPDLLEAAKRLAAKRPDVQFIMPVAEPVAHLGLTEQVAASGVPVTCVDGHAVEILSACTVAAVTSGTATLQAALADTPGVVVYRAAPLTWFIGRRLVRLPEVSLVNLVAGGPVVPELLQHDFTPQAVCDHLVILLTDEAAANAQKKALAAVRKRMGKAGAAERAAAVVVERLDRERE